MKSDCIYHWILSLCLLALAACSSGTATVSLLSGVQLRTSALEFSAFSPGGSPSNSAGTKKITITGNSTVLAYRALMVDGAAVCAAQDYSALSEKNLGTEFSFPVTLEGNYKVCALAKKADGTWQSASEAVASGVLVVDLTPPTLVSFTTNQTAYINAPLLVTVVFSEDLLAFTSSNLSFTNLSLTSINRVSTGTYQVVLTPQTQGAVNVNLSVMGLTDKAGNAASVGAVTTTISRTYDSIAPTSSSLVINSGATYTTLSTVSLQLSASGGPTEMYITNDSSCTAGGTWETIATTKNNWALAAVQGSQTVYAKFRDPALNESACVGASIILDSVAPTVSITSSATTPYLTAPVTLTYTFSEAMTAFSASAFSATGATLSNFTRVNPSIYTVLVSPTADGNFSVAMNAGAFSDLAGNSMNGITYAAAYDATPPTAPVVTNSSVPDNLTQTPLFSLTTSSSDSPFGNFTYQIKILKTVDNSEVVAWTAFTSNQRIAGLNLLENTSYTAYVRAVDAAGNLGVAGTTSWLTYQRPYTPLAWTYAPNNYVTTLAVQTNQKILVGGGFNAFGTTATSFPFAAQLNADSSADTGFSVGTGFDSYVYDSAVQADGKIIVAGTFYTYKGVTSPYLIRLNTDGSVDSSFNIGSGPDNTVKTVALQSDGKIIIGGYFSSYNGTSSNRLARLNTNGSIDTSFNTGSGFNGSVTKVAVQSDGTIYAAGSFTNFNGSTAGNIARLTSVGALDGTFIMGSGFGNGANTSYVTSIGIQGTALVVTGYFSTYKGLSVPYVVRLTSLGVLDTTFIAAGGTGANSSGTSLLVQADGKIVVSGYFNYYSGVYRNYLARLNSDGSLDSNFTVGTGLDQTADSLAQQSDGKILVGGAAHTYNGIYVSNLARLGTDGSLDTTFNAGSGFNGSVMTVKVLSSGKIFVAGTFSSYGGTNNRYLARINADMSLDTAFNAGGTNLNGFVKSILIQSDGKILLGGGFTTYNDVSGKYLIRLNSDGSRDSTLSQAAGGLNSSVQAMALQADGKIVVTGAFNYVNSTNQNYIGRLNTDGSTDSGFAVGTGFNDMPYAIAVQSDGKILLAGSFTSYNGTAVPRVVRLLASGAIDTSFTVGTGFDATVYSMTLQSDGKILFGGYFTTYNGVAAPYITRLNSDGSKDTTFDPGVGPDSAPQVMTVLSSGKILVTGSFYTYNGITRPFLVRLTSTGAVDTSFNSGTGFNNQVYDVKVLSSGNYVVGGYFTTFNGTSTPYLTVIAPPP